eukprot:COSAG01_NODE_695_length_14201_cov_10.521875_19_plen_66_part_00
MCLKEDYDFTAAHIWEYGRVCRVNRLFVKAKHLTNAGGAVADRTGAKGALRLPPFSLPITSLLIR